MNIFGRDKRVCEPSRLKRWAYRLFGEIHIPGRFRAHHILREIDSLHAGERAITVLDAGSGRGDLAVYLAKRYPLWRIVGVELSEERAAIARSTITRAGLTNVSIEVA